MQNNDALKNLLYRIADDELIIAHRNSEWTGLGPILEEDIAFSSIAQDKLGHAQALYEILHSLGEAEPDTIAFTRNEKDFFSCHFVEYPIGEYDFSLMRNFLFNTSEQIRFRMLENCSFEPLSLLAKKLRGEIKYHVFHGRTWVTQLGASGTESSRARMQSALSECFPLALGIFENSDFEQDLIAQGIFAGENALRDAWLKEIAQTIEKAGLTMPDPQAVAPAFGGRKGFHTEFLQPLLDEMTEVFRIDPAAEW